MHSTISNQIQAYLVQCKGQKLLAKNSLRAYRVDFQQFVAFLRSHDLENEPVSSISKDILRLYVSHLLSTYATRTCKRKIACIKAFFNYLEFEDIIEVNPFRKIRIKFQEPQRLPKTMSSKEIETILSKLYSKKCNMTVGKQAFEIRRNIACVELLFSSGMRVGELCSLSMDSVDLKSRTIRIIGKGNKERMIYIASDDALHALREYEKMRNESILSSERYFITYHGKPFRSDAVRRLVHHAASRVLHRRITPHMFRHTFASLLLGNNVDIRTIQELLGHSSITTTQIYLHLTTGRLKAILTEHHPRCSMQIRQQFAV